MNTRRKFKLSDLAYGVMTTLTGAILVGYTLALIYENVRHYVLA
jgi:hypothetical protein